MERKSIDPILWDVTKFVVDNGDYAFESLQSTFGIDEQRANSLIDYLCIAGIATMTTFGPRSKYFDEDALWERYSLLDFIYNKRTELEAISPEVKIFYEGRIVSARAQIDGFNCLLALYIDEDDLVGILRVRPHTYHETITVEDEPFASQLVKDNFMSSFEYEDPDKLMKYFPIDFYDCAFDWYKKVLAKFKGLGEAKK